MMPRSSSFALARLSFVLSTAVAAYVSVLSTAPAFAYVEFQNEFRSMYARGPKADRAFKRVVIKAKCNVCHRKDDSSQSEKPLNAFGIAMARHVEGVGKKDKPKIVEAIKKTTEERIDPQEVNGPTFGDLFREGRLVRERLEASGRGG